MRRLSMVIWVVFVVVGAVYAQTETTSITCENRTTFTPELTVTAPNLKLEQPDAGFNLVAVLGVEDYRPFMTLATIEDFSLCAPLDSNLSILNVALPENSIFNTQLAMQGVPADPQNQIIVIGTDAPNPRAFPTVMIQGNRINQQERQNGDVFELALTEALLARAQYLHVALVALTDSAYNPLLELVDAQGNLLQDAEGTPLRCDDVGDEATCYTPEPTMLNSSMQSVLGIAFANAQSAYLKVPLAALSQEVNVRVASNRTQGDYVLVVYFTAPAPEDAAQEGDETIEGIFGVAEVTQSDEGIYSLTCDGQATWTNGTLLQIPDGAFEDSIVVTVVGNETYAPIVAVLDEDEKGYCAENNRAARPYSATLPSGVIAPQETSVQVRLTNRTDRVFIGNRNGSGGEFSVFIEGLEITRTTPFATVSVAITPNLTAVNGVFQVFMVAHAPNLDPLLRWVNEEGTTNKDPLGQDVACDNAGNPENCYGLTVSLRGFQLVIGDENKFLNMDSVDAWLVIPMVPQGLGDALTIRAEFTSVRRGAFTLVLRMISV